ncbi:MAG TPA: type II toxin-antitoxin system RelE/ParE family toxin [Acidobacteriota bacterium]
MKRLVYSREALRVLRRMPTNTAKRIRAKMRQYAAAPAELARNVSGLKGEPGYYRLRVGAWRVVFREDARTVAVIRIAPRGRAYE